jgi:hydrogenase/urease accessory protein HupE
MSAFLKLLPLSFVMIAGPQVISSIFLATSANWRRNSAAYVVGAALSISLFIAVGYLIGKGIKSSGDKSSSHDSSSDVINALVLVLLLIAAFHVYRGRKESKPPKWMGKLEHATPRFTFTLGILLLGIFPTDLATSIAVGAKLPADAKPLWYALGFLVLTLLLLALPALVLLIFGKRAEAALPKVRTWMNTQSWVVSEIVLALFVALTISDLLSK